MPKNKLLFPLLFVLILIICALATFFILRSSNTLVFHPKGIIAKKEFDLIIINLILMLSILVPTFFWLVITVWKYQAQNKKDFEPEKKIGGFKEVLLWLIPSVIVAIMAIITWYATHELDPYQPLASKDKELTIQVVALDWKWLFIYPNQEIATVNYVQFPEKKPIRFELVADGSPMNSFWIPELSGQIYCMAGMVTPLHVMADKSGIYSGKAAEINGAGYAKMRFTAESTSEVEFEEWVSKLKSSPLQLDSNSYQKLVKRSIDHPIELYSNVEKDLFEKIVMKAHEPPRKP